MEYKCKKPSSTTKTPQKAAVTPKRPAPLNLQRQQQTSSLQGLAEGLQAWPAPLQRDLAQPALTALSLQRAEEQHLDADRQSLQRQAAELSAALPEHAVSAAVQRQAAASQRIQAPVRPQGASDWVTVMRSFAQQYEQVNARSGLDSREVAQYTALQRQTAHALVKQVNTSSKPAAERYAEFAQQAVTLQRHPLTANIPRAAIGFVNASERPALQRAVTEATDADALQRQQDEQALQLHGIQRQLAELDEQATQPVMQRIQARRGAGNPLPEAVQRHLEQGLNHDLSRVRIHDDAEADKLSKAVNATAFTTGSDIFFQSGKYNPSSATGYELLAHEVTHTVQQSKGQVGKGIDPDAGLEAEAQAMGRKLAATKRPGGKIPVQHLSQVIPLTVDHAVQRKPATPQPTATTIPIPAEIEQYILKRPHLLADALINGYLVYTYPDSTLPIPPRHFPIKILKPLFDKLTSQDVEIIKKSMFSRKIEFYGRLSKVFGADYALSLQKRVGTPPEISQIQLTADAFIEQLTSRASYMSNISLDELEKDISPTDGKKVSNFQPKSLLKFFGFRSEVPILGQWGFQMRIFQPIPVAQIKDKAVINRRTALGLNHPIIVFRGTEGVQFNTTEGGADTLIGDTAKASVGVLQVRMNENIIKSAMKRVKSGIFAGHSLGGGIAQVVAAKYPAIVHRVVTFQSPGLPKDQADLFTKNNPSAANHYRVAGDIVPNAGQTLLPGEINYFTRYQKDKGAPNFKTAIEPASSHVALPLLTFLQGQDPVKLSLEQKALLQFGAHDRGEVQKGLQARMTHSGTFNTAQDPRVVIEGLRSTVAPVLTGDMQYTLNMAEAHLGYNLLLEAVQPRLAAAKDFKSFQTVYNWVKSIKQLKLTSTQEGLLTELGIRNSTPAVYPINISDDPKAIIPQLNIPLPGTMSEATFLNDIRANGEIVNILEVQRQQVISELALHWSAQHNGKDQALDWQKQIENGRS